jgi:hypothetical protein
MSEVLSTTEPTVSSSHVQTGEDLKPIYRDTILQDLLGTDYEHAKETGLIDAFYYNEDTGEDALLHVLSGDIVMGENGANIPQGFHHEPSARDKRTFVDREHLQGANNAHRRLYREFPYEPYPAQVIIDGFAKRSLQLKDDGQTEIVPAKSGMFPKEYDALAVMKTIVEARDSRDKEKDVIDLDDKVKLAQASAVLLDGETTMKLRLVLDGATEKVITAFPLNSKRSGLMNLTREETREHLGL